MSLTWTGEDPAPPPAPGALGRVRMVLRGASLLFVTYFGMIFVLILNAANRGRHTGTAHSITCLWGRICLRLCGVRLKPVGVPMSHHGAVVSNHVGWIDIFTLLSADRVHFVSKAEVARWPVVGVLSRQIGTVYIDRRRTAAKKQEAELARRLDAGDRLCFFPEGTSTDGRRVLEFRSTLFAALFSVARETDIWVQPVTLVYRPQEGLEDRFYGWWGDMALGPHLKAVFSLSTRGVVEVVHHTPLRVRDYPDRKALALAAESAVRRGMIERIGPER